MFIAIEGCDGSGKSSLISAIKEEIASSNSSAEIVMHHKGKPPQETRRCLLYEYAIDYETVDFASTIHLADRWHWGERTYAPIKRPHTNKDGYGLLGVAGWRWVELFMQSRGMAQFYLYQKPEVIKNRLSARGDDFITLDEIDQIYNAYNLTAKSAALISETIIPGESSIADLPEFAKHVIDIATAVAERARHLSKYPGYIGATKPSVLILGDKRNVVDVYGDETVLPFMPVNSNSGEFLLEALPEQLWPSVGIVNANEISSQDLMDLHVALGSPPIAALGRMAERAVLKTSIHVDDYVVMHHPQFVKRFKHSKKHEYGEAIARVSRKEHVKDWRIR